MSNKSNNNSLRARLSQPNKLAKQEYLRSYDPYIHFKSVNKLLGN